MEKWELIAHKAKNLLTVCVAKGIDQAMTDRKGSQWFLDFVLDEATYEPGKQIARSEQKSVSDLDFQGLLKILRYREDLANQVLTHYSFFAQMDSYAAEGQRKQLNNLLDRLIKDFRNGIQAHPRAADIEKELSGQGIDRLYGYIDAYRDMYKLARVFSDVVDDRGYSYAKQIIALSATENTTARNTNGKPTNKKKTAEYNPNGKNRTRKRKADKEQEEKKTIRKKSRLRIWLPILGAVGSLAVVIALVLGNITHVGNLFINDNVPKLVNNEISVQPYQVYYDDEELVAVCYVVNGTDQIVTDVDVYRFTLLSEDKIIADAHFGKLDGISIAPGQEEKWVFRFPVETIYVEDAYLPDLQIEAWCR